MKGQRMLIGVLIVGLLLALAGGLGQAQGPVPEGDIPAGDEPGAAVGAVIPIQGRLTDASGVPLNGTYGIQAAIYDAGGAFLCGDWQSVTMTNGLFSMNVGTGLAVPCQSSQINGDELYLGITVGPLGTSEPEMTPRQPIYPVPYAWTVRPGAIIKGADSYVFVPGTAMVKNESGDSTRWDMQVNGSIRVYRGGAAGDKSIYFPITLPSVLYGQGVTVKSITVYYRCENGDNNFITSTWLYKQTDADSQVQIIDDLTDRKVESATSYTLNLTSDNVLSSAEGILALHLALTFANDAEYVQIGGVRLRLSHQ